MPAFKSISHRLIFWILSAGALIFIGSSYYDYKITQRFFEQQIKTRAEIVKADRLNQIEALLHSVRSSVQVAAEVLEVATPDDNGINALLKKMVLSHEHIFGMTIALEPRVGQPNFAPYYYHAGDEVRYVNLARDNYNYRRQPWYAQAVASGEGRWSEPYFDDNGGDIAMVTFSQPIFGTGSQQGDVIGVVTADISLKKLDTLVSDIESLSTGFAYIFSRKGNVITHSNPAMVMTNLHKERASGRFYLQAQLMLESMLAGNSNTRTVACDVSEKTGRCWLSFQPLQGANWSVAVILPMDELSEDLESYQTNALLITGIGLLFLAVLVAVISRRVTVPLLALASTSREFADGHLDVQVQDCQLQDEVGTLARQFQRMQRSLQQYISDLELVTRQRERLEGELGAAHDIQMQMLPDQGRSDIDNVNWQLSALLEPAKSVGGDFYHYQVLSSRQLFFAVGDVSDKGVAAALFMAKTQTLLRQLCSNLNNREQALAVSMPALLADINRQLCQGNDSCMFVTLLCGVMDVHSGELTLASAGHPGPLLLADTVTQIAVPAGPALGFYEAAEFSSHASVLLPGSCLLLTTDGVDEAANPCSEHFGEARLSELMLKLIAGGQHDCPQLLASLLAAVKQFRAGAEPSDDLTAMLLKRH